MSISDHGNGSYTWRTTIPWPGISKLDLELVHPSEAVLDMVMKTNSTEAYSIQFLGTYPSGAKVKCGIFVR